jgi:miniconductance mechanosensitive channel
MEKIQIYVERLIEACGITGDTVSIVTHIILVIIAFLLAAIAGWICKRLFVPTILKLTSKTDATWDDVIFNEKVLLTACSIIPAIVIWLLLPWTFFEFPSVREVLTRLTAIYITVMSVRTVFVFIDSLKLLEKVSVQQSNSIFIPFAEY